jgi:WD40 repeat protein
MQEGTVTPRTTGQTAPRVINLNYSWSDLEPPPISTASRPLTVGTSSRTLRPNRHYSRKEGKGLFMLADELFLYILSFLDPIDLIESSLVCKEFKRLVSDEVLWRGVYHTYWKRDSVFRTSWKEAVRMGMLSEANWEQGRHRKFILKGAHTGPINCLELNGEAAISGGADGNIQVWNTRDGAERVKLRGHTGEIRALECRSRRLFSASADSTVRIWSIFSKDCLQVLSGHQGAVESLQADDTYLVTGSQDNTIKLWDVGTGQCVRTWREHSEPVTRLALRNGRTIISASSDSYVKLWDKDSSTCIQTLKHPSAVSCLQVRDYNIVSSARNVIYLWEMRMGRWHKLKAHTRPVLTLHYYDENRMVSGGMDAVVRVWDLTQGNEEMIGAFEGHTQGIKCISCDGRRVVSGGQDRTIRVYDLEEGQCMYALLFPDWINCLAFDETTLVGAADSTLSLFSFY